MTPSSARRLAWSTDGRDWPGREASRFVSAEGLVWHVQTLGTGPLALLLHGTGSSTHSWRDFAPLLAEEWSLLLIDLPGHGFTSAGRSDQSTLPGMSRAVAGLLRVLGVAPRLIVGHSAGAALGARLALDRRVVPEALVGLGAALMPWAGPAGRMFTPLARLLAVGGWMPRCFAWRARDPGTVDRLIRSVGSRLDARGIECYRRLISNPGHVEGALAMMAGWDLPALWAELPRLEPRLCLISGSQDRAVPPTVAAAVEQRVRGTRHRILPGLGHLAHEEDPMRVAAVMKGLLGTPSERWV